MNGETKKIGILTFHASYNCGSMLQAYATQCFLKKNGYMPEIIDFSSPGQKQLYSLYFHNDSLRNVVKNCVVRCHRGRILKSFDRYERFKKQHFWLTPYNTSNMEQLRDDYYAVVAGADQIWNITIDDYDDAYFLPWVKNARRIAYAPSFGARSIAKHSGDPEKFKDYLNRFDYLSIRENNGQRWIRELIGKDVPVVLDPTMLLEEEDYKPIISDELKLPDKYIFYYSPSYCKNINKMVSDISQKYGMPVIAFNAKSYYLRAVNFTNIKLPVVEDPSVYMQLMKHASMVITTSFHGTIFASMFRKCFWVIKNGEMLGDDDRVYTLTQAMGATDRMIDIGFDASFDYLQMPDYEAYERKLEVLRKNSVDYLLNALKKDETDK